MVEVAPAVIARARTLVDRELDACADRLRTDVGGTIGEAIAYALCSPGKRVRPALVLAAYEACGGSHPGIAGVAAAVEIVHTYSLVHDDLPCMDDDPLRRGRPTTHVVYGVPVATRVGYLLVPIAAEALARAADTMKLEPEALRRMAVALFEAGGIRGMVGGQWLDLEAEGVSLDLQQLMTVHRGKTGALIRSAVELGGLAAGAPEPVLNALRSYGEELGLAFQVADDVLDATATSEILGKTAGKDEERAKSTYVGLLGVAAARLAAVEHEARGLAALEEAGVATAVLGPLARYIVTRSS
ncbi:MAG: farnesyl-diphosphate synthase [Gemmatimonadetes bacterium HGW-Gemmatimonadetes-1]|nr:MAG: farnesyl-diphosphate synthase [Gemmatimonadetes bacterium HGW-Gemmatimonadetes-1]